MRDSRRAIGFNMDNMDSRPCTHGPSLREREPVTRGWTARKSLGGI